MRTGSDPSVDDFLLNIPEPVHPIHVVTTVPSTPQHVTSPVMSVIPMEPVPANVMSPDEMLRAYAERKKSMAANQQQLASSPSLSSIGPIEFPKAVVKKRSIRSSLKGAGNTMRVLYNATRSLTPSSPSSPTHTNSPTKLSSATSMNLANHDSFSSYGQAISPIEPFDTENLAGMGTVNPHPFGYHPQAYDGPRGGDHDEEEEDVGEVEAIQIGHAS